MAVGEGPPANNVPSGLAPEAPAASTGVIEAALPATNLTPQEATVTGPTPFDIAGGSSAPAQRPGVAEAARSVVTFVPDLQAVSPESGGSTQLSTRDVGTVRTDGETAIPDGVDGSAVNNEITVPDEGSADVAGKAAYSGRTRFTTQLLNRGREVIRTARFGLRGERTGPGGAREDASGSPAADSENSLATALSSAEEVVPAPVEVTADAGTAQIAEPREQEQTETVTATSQDIVIGLAQTTNATREREIAGFARSEAEGFDQEREAHKRRERREAHKQEKAEIAARHKEDERLRRTKTTAEVMRRRAERTPEALRRLGKDVAKNTVTGLRPTDSHGRVVLEEGLRMGAAGADQAIPAELRGKVREYAESHLQKKTARERIASARERWSGNPSEVFRKVATLKIRDLAKAEATAYDAMARAYQSGTEEDIAAVEGTYKDAWTAYGLWKNGELTEGARFAEHVIEGDAGDTILAGVTETTFDQAEQAAIKERLLVRWTAEAVANELSIAGQGTTQSQDQQQLHSQQESLRLRHDAELQDFLESDPLGPQIAAKLGMDDAFSVASTITDVVRVAAEVIANDIREKQTDGALVDAVSEEWLRSRTQEWYDPKTIHGVGGKKQPSPDEPTFKQYALKELGELLQGAKDAQGSENPQAVAEFIQSAKRTRGLKEMTSDFVRKAGQIGVRKGIVYGATTILGAGFAAATGGLGFGVIAGFGMGAWRGGGRALQRETEAQNRAIVDRTRNKGGDKPLYTAGERHREIAAMQNPEQQKRAALLRKIGETVKGGAIGAFVGAAMGAGAGEAAVVLGHAMGIRRLIPSLPRMPRSERGVSDIRTVAYNEPNPQTPVRVPAVNDSVIYGSGTPATTETVAAVPLHVSTDALITHLPPGVSENATSVTVGELKIPGVQYAADGTLHSIKTGDVYMGSAEFTALQEVFGHVKFLDHNGNGTQPMTVELTRFVLERDGAGGHPQLDFAISDGSGKPIITNGVLEEYAKDAAGKWRRNPTITYNGPVMHSEINWETGQATITVDETTPSTDHHIEVSKFLDSESSALKGLTYEVNGQPIDAVFSGDHGLLDLGVQGGSKPFITDLGFNIDHSDGHVELHWDGPPVQVTFDAQGHPVIDILDTQPSGKDQHIDLTQLYQERTAIPPAGSAGEVMQQHGTAVSEVNWFDNGSQQPTGDALKLDLIKEGDTLRITTRGMGVSTLGGQTLDMAQARQHGDVVLGIFVGDNYKDVVGVKFPAGQDIVLNPNSTQVVQLTNGTTMTVGEVTRLIENQGVFGRLPNGPVLDTGDIFNLGYDGNSGHLLVGTMTHTPNGEAVFNSAAAIPGSGEVNPALEPTVVHAPIDTDALITHLPPGVSENATSVTVGELKIPGVQYAADGTLHSIKTGDVYMGSAEFTALQEVFGHVKFLDHNGNGTQPMTVELTRFVLERDGAGGHPQLDFAISDGSGKPIITNGVLEEYAKDAAGKWRRNPTITYNGPVMHSEINWETGQATITVDETTPSTDHHIEVSKFLDSESSALKGLTYEVNGQPIDAVFSGDHGLLDLGVQGGSKPFITDLGFNIDHSDGHVELHWDGPPVQVTFDAQGHPVIDILDTQPSGKDQHIDLTQLYQERTAIPPAGSAGEVMQQHGTAVSEVNWFDNGSQQPTGDALKLDLIKEGDTLRITTRGMGVSTLGGQTLDMAQARQHGDVVLGIFVGDNYKDVVGVKFPAGQDIVLNPNSTQVVQLTNGTTMTVGEVTRLIENQGVFGRLPNGPVLDTGDIFNLGYDGNSGHLLVGTMTHTPNGEAVFNSAAAIPGSGEVNPALAPVPIGGEHITPSFLKLGDVLIKPEGEGAQGVKLTADGGLEIVGGPHDGAQWMSPTEVTTIKELFGNTAFYNSSGQKITPELVQFVVDKKYPPSFTISLDDANGVPLIKDAKLSLFEPNASNGALRFNPTLTGDFGEIKPGFDWNNGTMTVRFADAANENLPFHHIELANYLNNDPSVLQGVTYEVNGQQFVPVFSVDQTQEAFNIGELGMNKPFLTDLHFTVDPSNGHIDMQWSGPPVRLTFDANHHPIIDVLTTQPSSPNEHIDLTQVLQERPAEIQSVGSTGGAVTQIGNLKVEGLTAQQYDLIPASQREQLAAALGRFQFEDAQGNTVTPLVTYQNNTFTFINPTDQSDQFLTATYVPSTSGGDPAFVFQSTHVDVLDSPNGQSTVFMINGHMSPEHGTIDLTTGEVTVGNPVSTSDTQLYIIDPHTKYMTRFDLNGATVDNGVLVGTGTQEGMSEQLLSDYQKYLPQVQVYDAGGTPITSGVEFIYDGGSGFTMVVNGNPVAEFDIHGNMLSANGFGHLSSNGRIFTVGNTSTMSSVPFSEYGSPQEVLMEVFPTRKEVQIMTNGHTVTLDGVRINQNGALIDNKGNTIPGFTDISQLVSEANLNTLNAELAKLDSFTGEENLTLTYAGHDEWAANVAGQQMTVTLKLIHGQLHFSYGFGSPTPESSSSSPSTPPASASPSTPPTSAPPTSPPPRSPGTPGSSGEGFFSKRTIENLLLHHPSILADDVIPLVTQYKEHGEETIGIIGGAGVGVGALKAAQPINDPLASTRRRIAIRTGRALGGFVEGSAAAAVGLGTAVVTGPVAAAAKLSAVVAASGGLLESFVVPVDRYLSTWEKAAVRANLAVNRISFAGVLGGLSAGGLSNVTPQLISDSLGTWIPLAYLALRDRNDIAYRLRGMRARRRRHTIRPYDDSGPNQQESDPGDTGGGRGRGDSPIYRIEPAVPQEPDPGDTGGRPFGGNREEPEV